MKLAEDSLVHSRPKQWAARVLIAVGLIALVTLLTMAVRHLVNQPDAPKRQTAKITILPDTPPPPSSPKTTSNR
jgi:protein TonB